MTIKGQYAQNIIVAAGSWRLKFDIKEVRLVLPDLAAFSKRLKQKSTTQSSLLEDAVQLLQFLDEKPASEETLALIVRNFENDFLQNKDIHSLANELDPAQSRLLLRLSSKHCGFGKSNTGPARSESGLLKAATEKNASILATFGGQGLTNTRCLTDLRAIIETYGTIVRDLVKEIAQCLRNWSASPRAQGYFAYDSFDLETWLEDPSTAPDSVKLAEAPFSFPLIGLLSLLQYRVAIKASHSSPRFFRATLEAATGHSQGIIAAAVVCLSDTWADFMHNSVLAVKLLFWIGVESHFAAHDLSFEANGHQLIHASEAQSFMLSVRGIGEPLLLRHIHLTNQSLPPTRHVDIALRNNVDNFVVAGPPKSLSGLRVILGNMSATEDVDQSRVPYPQRKPIVHCDPLPISAPFHSHYMAEAANRVKLHMANEAWKIPSSATPLLRTSTGDEIFAKSSDILTSELIEMVMTEKVDWVRSCLTVKASHILDFGPGKCSTLLRKSIEGSSTKAILVTEKHVEIPGYGQHIDFYTPSPPTPVESWCVELHPAVQQVGEKRRIVTRMTNLLGIRPVMVGGMTPTTVSPTFVSAILKSGYEAELACGGYTDSTALEGAIRSILSSSSIEHGLTCNVIYVSPRQIAWQIPLIKTLIAKGIRINGLTVGGGVPSIEIANEWIRTLGVRRIAFKPGSIAAIEQVLNIADQNSSFPIGLQWTSGRAGGHHSYEDFHEPMLKTYGAIRRRKNIVLVAGGGFGDAEGAAPYISGQWSADYGRPLMPFDGVLIGSRVMAAAEARTSMAVKELIVQASGCGDADWHNTYRDVAGGVVTVLSEMGQPIHVLANRAMKLWKELDDRLFSVKESTVRLQKLIDMRQSLKPRLNSDFAKPWFATVDGCCLEIETMTYHQSLLRLVELMYIEDTDTWIDPSYQIFVRDWMRRICQRFSMYGTAVGDLTAAKRDIECFLHKLSAFKSVLIYPDDVSFFMNICRRRGQKPVNFIPRLDSDFETYFKKDSLWQSECLEAVPGQDPEKVCIIHGPIAAKHTLKANESVGAILDGIYSNLASILSSNSPVVKKTAPQRELEAMVNANIKHVLWKGDLQQSHEDLVHRLLPEPLFWAKACLTQPQVLRGPQSVANPIRAAFQPQLGDEIEVCIAEKGIQSVVLTPNPDEMHRFRRPLRLERDPWGKIHLSLASPGSDGTDARLTLTFELSQGDGTATITETTLAREASIRNFYAAIWNCGSSQKNPGPVGTPQTQTLILSPAMVQTFLAALGSTTGREEAYGSFKGVVPIDTCIMIAWRSLMQSLLASNVPGDLFQLLHRSTEFEYASSSKPLMIGDEVTAISRVVEIATKPSGRSIKVMTQIQRLNQKVLTVQCDFLIRGTFDDQSSDFSCVAEPPMMIRLNSTKVQAVLLSRTWLKLDELSGSLLDADLVFELESTTQQRQLTVVGNVFKLLRCGSQLKVGEVCFDRPVAPRNPVMDLLRRHGRPKRQTVALEQPGWKQLDAMTLGIPRSGDLYSDASLDRNPIHTCPYFAGLAGLEKPITHGMFTSAAVRRLVERNTVGGDISRFQRWTCFFDAKVLHGQTLQVQIEHKAMVEGRMVLDVKAIEVGSKQKVLHAEAEVEQMPSAFLFCGQGSQEKGMGMTLYDADPVAKQIWKRGAAHLEELYGFSLIDIVRNEPKELTLYFQGKRGRSIRQNYLNISRTVFRDGKYISEPVLAGLTPRSTSYTFSDSRGLLSSTQFAQPALTLMEIVEKKTLEAQGVLQQNTLFAGHSLGEYSALASCTSFMSLEDLLDLVFYRGLIMQRAIERNEQGQTEYSMMAVNPSRVATWFDEKCLIDLVRHVSQQTSLLLEIVNWNVEGQQYVCAGSMRALLLLTRCCESFTTTAPAAKTLLELVQELAPSCMSYPSNFSLPKSAATTPLSGIDVPFHSTALRNGIDGYRAYLKDKIVVDDIMPSQFVGKWIPNVVGTPFRLERDYVEEVQRITSSEPLKLLLEGQIGVGG